VPQVVFQHPLFDSHLRSRVQVLHLAAPASARMQAKVWAAWPHPLRAFAADGTDLALFPVVLFARDVDLHTFTRQGAFDEDDLSRLGFSRNFFKHIGAPGNALCVEV
jgi:hypothetical protein